MQDTCVCGEREIGQTKAHRGDAEARRKLKATGKVKTSTQRTQRNFGGHGELNEEPECED